MSWIKEISFEEATGKLKRVYEKVVGPNNNVDNILSAHSLRPHTLTGHMSLYKNVLHNSNNTLPKWYLETIGVYVSSLNKCDYCVEHHFSGMRRLVNDDTKSSEIYTSIKNDSFGTELTKQEQLGLAYAKELTLSPSNLSESMLDTLRANGFDDGEILEINQVTAYFNYANRTVLGLGINTDGDIIGLSPNNSEDENDWGHK